MPTTDPDQTTDPEPFTGPVRGAVVRYHGSLTGYHGEAVLLGPGVLETVAEGQLLLRVRRQSYDLIPVPVAGIVRRGVDDDLYHWAATDPGRASCGPTRLDDSTAARPGFAPSSSRCPHPACAGRWSDWLGQVDELLRPFVG